MNTEPQQIPETTPSIFKPIGRKPTGKIAQLPKAQRAIVNQMLDDGATYDAIETEMAKHDVSLNGENISNWFQNGFQQYLQHQDHLAEMRLLRENASDLVQDYNVIQFHQAANQLAVGQIFKALTRQELTADPVNYVRTINALARLSRAALVLKEHEDELAKSAEQTAKSEGPQDLEDQRRLMIKAFEGATGIKAAPGPIGPDLNEYFARASSAPQAGAGQPQEKPTEAIGAEPTPQTAPVSQQQPVHLAQKQKPKLARPEPCLECSAPLPPLLPSGERLYPHCQKCGTSLRPPGALIEYCPHCRRLLPELNALGERPTPDCPHCIRPLPPAPFNLNPTLNHNPQLPDAA